MVGNLGQGFALAPQLVNEGIAVTGPPSAHYPALPPPQRLALRGGLSWPHLSPES